MKSAEKSTISEADLHWCRRNRAAFQPKFCRQYRTAGNFGFASKCGPGCDQIEEMDRLAELPQAERRIEIAALADVCHPDLPVIAPLPPLPVLELPPIPKKTEEVHPMETKKEAPPALKKPAKMCLGCERIMPISGNGLCGKCYHLSHRRGMPLSEIRISNGIYPAPVPAPLCDPPSPALLSSEGLSPLPISPFSCELDRVLDHLRGMLIAKNEAYGDSARNPVRCFSKADPAEAIRVRIDDKISRLMRGDDAGEDTVLDLIGYLILLRMVEVSHAA